MPQYANARINFGDIMQAVEDQLVADAVVENRAQISWGTPDNIPQFSGPFDVLLIARRSIPNEGGPHDGGAAQLQLVRHLDIWLRAQVIGDPGGGFKDWIKSTFVLADKIIDSVGNNNFWPEDEAGNLLTVESIKLLADVAPEKPRTDSAFGDYVCTLSCHYMPKIDPTKGPQ